MVVTLKSNIPYLQDVSGSYTLTEDVTVKEWLAHFDIKWDFDVLVILNGTFSHGDEWLKDRDLVELLIPLSGG